MTSPDAGAADAFTSRPGAVGSPPEHYGSHVAEQRALAAGDAVVLLADRGVITVTGPDRLTWLDSLLSQALAKLRPGESAEALLLDPQGRIEHVMRVLDDGESTWLLVDAAAAPALAAWLDRMRFMLRVEVADRSAEFATIGDLGGGELPSTIAGTIPLQWRDPWPSVVVGGVQYAAEAGHPAATFAWRETLIERDRLGEFDGVPAAGTLAADALRIAAWRPAFAGEVDERTIPHELDWLRSAVHMNKGCYRGQETVAKVHNLGHPPRRLVMLHVDGSDSVLPAVGDPVVLEGQDAEAAIGRVTSAGVHHELGPIALAVVKRSVDPSVTLQIIHDGVRLAAAQEVVVPPSAGATADVPRLPRLGRR
jgi:hypothetical protein